MITLLFTRFILFIQWMVDLNVNLILERTTANRVKLKFRATCYALPESVFYRFFLSMLFCLSFSLKATWLSKTLLWILVLCLKTSFMWKPLDQTDGCYGLFRWQKRRRRNQRTFEVVVKTSVSRLRAESQWEAKSRAAVEKKQNSYFDKLASKVGDEIFSL